jgi:hypothetical protein
MDNSHRPNSPREYPFILWLKGVIITTFLILPAFVAMCWLYWEEGDGLILFATIILGFFLVVDLLRIWILRPNSLKRSKTKEEKIHKESDILGR